MAKQLPIDFLIIEDDKLFRDRLRQALTQRGMQVQCAESGPEALHVLDGHLPARILLDLKMPGTNGLELLPELRARAENAKIVILTGFGSIAAAESALKLGATSFLSKPCGLDRILEAFADSPQRAISTELHVPSLAQVEWEHIQRVLSDMDGNVSRTARALGLDRRSLQRRLAKTQSVS